MDRMSTPTQFLNGSDEYAYSVFEWIGWVPSIRTSRMAMSPPDHKKFHLGVARATGHRSFTDQKTRLWVRHISCKIRIPIDLYPCQVEKKLIVKEVKGETITKYETKITVNDGTVTKLPGKFPRYPPLNEEEEKPNKGPNYELLSYKVSDGDSDLKSTARSGPKYSELEDTCKSRVRPNT
ncbi:hypothetical protein Tco_1455251 [Tanacetum coccineum]